MRIKQSLLCAGLSVFLLAACRTVSTPSPVKVVASPDPTTTPAKTATALPTATLVETQCALTPIVAPTLPAVIPPYTALDRTTGLHRTGSYTETIDLQAYRLEISGRVDHPLQLSYDTLRCLPKVEVKTTLVCPGFFEDTTTWAGVPINILLELAGIQKEAERIEMTGADGYSTSIELQRLTEKAFVAYEWKGQPLPILHGFPVRTVFPGLAGSYWVKWLLKIEIK